MIRWVTSVVVLTALTFARADDATTAPATAPSTQPALTLEKSAEEGKSVLVAKVTVAGKPVEDATVIFSAERTFGRLVLGTEKTIDDGTAAIPFPKDLPAGNEGKLTIFADVKVTDHYAGARVEREMSGGVVVVAEDVRLPRALWAPQAPVALLGIVGGVIAAVWGSYAYVAYQVFRIHRGAKS